MNQKPPKYRAVGPPKKDFFEHLVQFRVSVKRKYYTIAQKEIHEIIKKYR